MINESQFGSRPPWERTYTFDRDEATCWEPNDPGEALSLDDDDRTFLSLAPEMARAIISLWESEAFVPCSNEWDGECSHPMCRLLDLSVKLRQIVGEVSLIPDPDDSYEDRYVKVDEPTDDSVEAWEVRSK